MNHDGPERGRFPLSGLSEVCRVGDFILLIIFETTNGQ